MDQYRVVVKRKGEIVLFGELGPGTYGIPLKYESYPPIKLSSNGEGVVLENQGLNRLFVVDREGNCHQAGLHITPLEVKINGQKKKIFKRHRFTRDILKSYQSIEIGDIEIMII